MTAKTAEEKVDAWMPLWIGAYLADTTHLSRDEHGGYLLLLMAYWRNKGPLLDSGNRLANICKATPAEWKRLRLALEEFFSTEDGYWTHKRADEELVKAGVHKAKAVSRAKAGAEARWKDHPKRATSNASSMPEALPEQRPTPTPTPMVEEPIGSSPTGSGDAAAVVAFIPTPAGAICRALRQAGFASVSPSHPGLLTLLDAGATEGEFMAFVDQARDKRDPFAYLLTVVARQREQAAEMAKRLHRGELPATETGYQRSMRERAEQVSPAIAAKRPGAAPAPNPMEVLDGLVRIAG